MESEHAATKRKVAEGRKRREKRVEGFKPGILDFANSKTPVIRQLTRKGWTAHEIARHLVPDRNGVSTSHDRRKRLAIRTLVYRVRAEDEEMRQIEKLAAMGATVESVQDITGAMIRRAKRGRMDAVRFAFEFAGIYNSKTVHEHTGSVEINLAGWMRPEQVQLESSIPVDAEVVEED